MGSIPVRQTPADQVGAGDRAAPAGAKRDARRADSAHRLAAAHDAGGADGFAQEASALASGAIAIDPPAAMRSRRASSGMWSAKPITVKPGVSIVTRGSPASFWRRPPQIAPSTIVSQSSSARSSTRPIGMAPAFATKRRGRKLRPYAAPARERPRVAAHRREGRSLRRRQPDPSLKLIAERVGSHHVR